MRYRSLIFSGIFAVLAVAYAVAFANDIQYYQSCSVTDSGTYTVSLGGHTTSVLVINDSATDSVFVSLDGPWVTTTDDLELKAGESVAADVRTTQLGLICASGKSAVVRVLGIIAGRD